MSVGDPTLQELAAAATAPESVPPAVAVIASSDVRTLDGAVLVTKIGAEQAETELQTAEERWSTIEAADAQMRVNSTAIKGKVAGELQDLIQEMYEHGEVPDPDILDDLMLLQSEESTVLDMSGPSDAEVDSELEVKRLEAIWRRDELQKRFDEARANRDVALERIKFVDLAKQIEVVRHKLSYPMRYASALLCAVVIGAGAAGLVYKAETMSNRDAAQITRATNRQYPNHRKPVPSLALDDNERVAVGAFGSLGLFMGGLAGMWVGEGLSGRTARWRARRIVRRSEAADQDQPEDQTEE